ncbi:MAG: hypothetical protein ABIP97_02920, partial [Chthoniobacterales bacterium]
MNPNDSHNPNTIELPRPSGWPILAAFGITMMLAGLVTNLAVSVVGILVGVVSGIGWFFDIFPNPKHDAVPIEHEVEAPNPQIPRERMVDYLKVGEHGHRVRIPVEVSPYSAGILGGLAGAVVMAILAIIYGLWKQGSVWYTINLLAAAAMPSLTDASIQTLTKFNMTAFIVATVLHLSGSIMVGLLYAALLPMLPRKFEWLWGGILTPLLWTTLIYASMGIINPTLAALIDWPYFIACQVAFGLVGGYVVFKSEKVETMQTWPLAAKLGVEAPQRKEDE